MAMDGPKNSDLKEGAATIRRWVPEPVFGWATFWRSKVSLRITLLIFACVLPTWLMASIQIYESYGARRDQTLKQTLEITRGVILSVDRELANVQSSLQALSTSPAFAAGDLATIYSQAKTVQSFFPGSDIIVADGDAQQLVNTYRSFGEPLPKRNNQEIVHRIFNEGKPIVSGLFLGALTKRALVGVDVPVMSNGRVVFDLSMTFPAGRIGELLAQHRLPAEWVGVIIDRNGVIVARSRNPEKYVGQPGLPNLRQKIALETEGMQEDVTLDGVPVETAYSRSTLSGWSAAIGVPKALLMSEVRQWLWWSLGGALVSSLAGIVLAFLIGGRIVRSNISLEESENRFRYAMEASSDGIWERDVQSGKMYFSPAYLTMLGYEPGEFPSTSHTWVDLIHPDDRHHAVDAAQDCIENRCENFSREFRMKAKDGSWKWVLGRGRAILRDPAGLALRLIGTHVDIHERKLLELTLKETNGDLEQFAYVASHDLRQPLRAVTNYLGLIEKKLGSGIDDSLKTHLGFAVNGAKRMDRLIVALLDYSRTGKYSESVPVPLSAAIADALANLAEAIRESDAKVSLSADFPVVIGDKTDLMRVFQNLIGNAIKYRLPDRSPQIDVGWSKQAVDYHVWVKDNGIGITPEDHDRAFAIFQRLVPKDAYEGTGIGLSVCKKIIERHGGRIWIESEVGEGSTFVFTLPDSSAGT